MPMKLRYLQSSLVLVPFPVKTSLFKIINCPVSKQKHPEIRDRSWIRDILILKYATKFKNEEPRNNTGDFQHFT